MASFEPDIIRYWDRAKHLQITLCNRDSINSIHDYRLFFLKIQVSDMIACALLPIIQLLYAKCDQSKSTEQSTHNVENFLQNKNEHQSTIFYVVVFCSAYAFGKLSCYLASLDQYKAISDDTRNRST